MDDLTTPRPLSHADLTTQTPSVVAVVHTEPQASAPLTEVVPEMLPFDSGDFAALVGGLAVIVLLLVICTIGVLLWCLARHKGSYDTNETDGDNCDIDEDEESVGSDAALQSKKPLKPKEEE